MKRVSPSRLFRAHQFAFLIGLSDGILTALTLAAGSVVGSHAPIRMQLALRIAAASSLSGTFVFFTAEYAKLRGELVHAERQLSLTSHGRLAATRLGRAVLLESLFGATLASICNFVGALFPLLVGAVLPGPPWLAAIAAIVALGVVGVVIAYSVHGNPFRWTIGLMMAGGLLTIAGAQLHVVS
jgi:VIT1/CCC1 family predicted Fe2+/Mn2+ transporter